MTTQNKTYAKMYNKVGAQSEVLQASPHRIIQMLMQGALDKMALAKGALKHEKSGIAGQELGHAIAILDCLRMSLDKTIGGELVENLESLYDYMGARLLKANLEKNIGYVDEVAKLMIEIKSGWDAIPADAHNAHQRRDAVIQPNNLGK